MAFVPVVITDAVGHQTRVLGKLVPAPNRADDVRKIQALLKKVLGPSAPFFRDGVCDDAMKRAISELQAACGSLSPDGTVDKVGHTLAHLNRLANPLALKPITTCMVEHGMYTIGYATCDGHALPPAGKGYTLHLGFPAETNSIEVTGQPANDLLSYKHNLGKVLGIFEKLAYWAPKQVPCQLYLKYKGAVLNACTSNVQTLRAPVQPHNGRMLPLDEVNNGPKLTYQGDVSADQFWGRMFAQALVPGYDKNIFVYPANSIGGKFENDNQFRGFDCITYVGTTCGASNFHMANSPDLASSLGATSIDHFHTVVQDAKTGKQAFDHSHPKDLKTGKDMDTKVQLEKADPACVKNFFATAPAGYFIMFSSGHVVLVANGKVYEFKASEPSGYCCTEKVADWLDPYKTMKLTVRRLPKKPARAV
jgi:hypothetical protein